MIHGWYNVPSAFLLFSSPGSQTREVFSLPSHKQNSYRLCSSRGGKKPLCCSDPARKLWLGSLSTLGRKPARSTELAPAKKDEESRTKLCKPNPVLKGLYNSCKGTVALKYFTKGSQISSYHAYCSVLWGARKAQQNPNFWLCNLEVIWHFKGLKASQLCHLSIPMRVAWGDGNQHLQTCTVRLNIPS